MAQRPQVRQFQAPTQADIRPAASAVDTFVRQAATTTQPSELSQFLTAITPAIEIQAEQRKVDRLKKEKEIADGIQANKEFQVKLQSKKFLGDLALDYTKNEQNYLGQDQDVVYAGIRGQKQEYIDTLTQAGVDNDIIQIFDQNVELGLETFMGETFRPAKYVHTQNTLLEGFGDTVRDINTQYSAGLLTADEAKQEIKDLFTGFHQVNNDYFAVNDNKVNDFLVDMAHKLKDSNPNSALTQYLQDPTYSKNQLGKSRYTQQSDDITTKQAALAVTQFNANAKASGLVSAVEQFRLTRKGSVLTDAGYTKKDGTTVKYTAKEKEDALFALAKEQGLGLGGQLDMFRDAGITPTRFMNFVNDGATLLVSGDPSSPQGFEKVQQGLQMYLMMKNSGIKMDLTDDQKLRYDLLAFKVYDQADVGTIEIPQYEEEMMTQTGVLTVQDFGNAAMQIQGLAKDRLVRIDAKARSEVTDKLQAGIFADVFGTDLSETYNTVDVENAVIKAYEALSILGERGTQEELIQKAANIVKADYQIPTSSDGTPYAFKDLNTGMDKALDVAGIVTEYNQALASSPQVKRFMLEKFGAKDFVLQVQPDPTNPKNAVIRAFRKQDGQVTDIGIITGKLDKVTLLSDRQQLNNIIANLIAPDDVSTAITPDINTMSTSGAAIEGQLQQDLTIPQYLLGGKGVEGVPVLSDLGGVLDSLGQWFVENPPIFNIDKETGDITFSTDSDEAYLSLPQQATNAILDAAKDLFGSGTGEVARPIEGMPISDVLDTLNPISSAAASTLIAEEGFEATPYDDMGKQSVGYGFQIESLEADEKALIKDINNVTEEEAKSVLDLKVSKLENWWDETVEGFKNLPQSSQVSAISMAYQLGKENVAREWPKFMEAIKEAGQYAEGSAEQAAALAKAKFNMLYNVAEDGAVTATKWATQTTDRAMRMAEGMAASAAETAQGMFNSIIPEAQAATLTPMKVGDKPDAEGVVAVATSPDPVTAAMKYMGISESSKNGSQAVKGFFDNAVGGEFAPDKSAYELATTNAWCAAFLAQVLADSGIDVQKAIGGKDRFDQTRAKSYLNIGEAVDISDVKAGDIMVAVHSKEDKAKYFKQKGKKLTSFGHVGIVVEAKDGELYYIGGNTGDKVKVSSYGIGSKDLRIRRLNDVKQIPREELPSLLEMEYGKLGKYADKLGKFFTGLYDNVLGD